MRAAQGKKCMTLSARRKENRWRGTGVEGGGKGVYVMETCRCPGWLIDGRIEMEKGWLFWSIERNGEREVEGLQRRSEVGSELFLVPIRMR